MQDRETETRDKAVAAANQQPQARWRGASTHWVPIAGALVGIASLAWTIASFFIPKPDAAKPVPMVQQNAETTNGLAVNAAGGAVVSVNGTSDAALAKARAMPAGNAASQRAKAGGDGMAVNATDGAAVVVNGVKASSR